MINSLGRELPDYLEGYGAIRPYGGVWTNIAGKRIELAPHGFTARSRDEVKLQPTLDALLDRLPLRDGMTVSFHHHLRNGDAVTNLVMEAIASRGVRDIHVASTGIFPCHAPLVRLIEEGIVTGMSFAYIAPGPVAQAITAGKLKKPAVFYTHGGRPRAIESGELHIDVAFVAAPTADSYGNMNGTQGKSACGMLSYVYTDASYADVTVGITDHLVEYPANPIEISQDFVDYVLEVESIGDPGGISTGTMKVADDPVAREIAVRAAEVIEESGYLRQGMSFQTGAGTVSISVAKAVRERMLALGVKGSFASGGISSLLVGMQREGLFRTLLDVQCFDQIAIRSAGENPAHRIMSASMYANPHTRGPVVNMLDVMIVGATEIDTDFNVNVITGSDGRIMGAAGGHTDCAACSKLTIVVTRLRKGKYSAIRDRVTTLATPGETIDVLVTDRGIAVNPLRADLLERLKDSGLPLLSIRDLKRLGEEALDIPEQAAFTDRIVGVVEYRDGTVIDVVRAPVWACP